MMIAQMLISLTGYCQIKPNITTYVLGNDTLFLANRQFLNLCAMKFDSLKYCTANYSECLDIIDTLQYQIQSKNTIIDQKNDIIISHEIEKSEMNHIMQSYIRENELNKDCKKALDIMTKKRNTYKTISIVTICTTIFASSLIFILK